MEGPRGIVRAARASPRAALLIPFVVEVFAGSAQFSKAAAALGYMCIALDWSFGPDCNLAKDSTVRMLLGWIQAGWVAFILMGPPCQSWSRARCRPGGPQMLRSNEFIYGLKVLRYESERHKIVNGNKTMAAAARVARACLRMNVPFVIENPKTSMLWLANEMLALKARKACRFFQSDFCLWGMPWRKPTGFLSGHCGGAISRVERICQNGTCKRTGGKHIVLAGVDPVSKCFWTHIAEQYPRGLAAALARMLHDSRKQLEHMQLGRHLGF